MEHHSWRIGTAPFRDGLLLHEACTGRLFELNSAAARVWRSLRMGKPKEVIVGELTRIYEADPAAVERDFEAFVDQLHRAGLLCSVEAVVRQSSAEARPPRGTPALDALYRVGEVPVRVVCYPAEVAAAFAPLAEPAMMPGGVLAEARLELFRNHDGFALTRNDHLVEKPDTAPEARWALVRQLVSAAGRRPCLALLHAGAIATPAGCLLIGGESGSGKSTLVAGLVHAGFAFVADDIVPLEEGTGLIRAVRLAISIKKDSWPLLGSMFPEFIKMPVIHFGGRTMRYLWPDSNARVIGTGGYRVTAVLFPRYAKNSRTTLRRLEPVRSLGLLGEGGSVLPSTDTGLAEFLGWWSMLPAYRLQYGRLDEAIRKLSTFINRRYERSAGAGRTVRARSTCVAGLCEGQSWLDT